MNQNRAFPIGSNRPDLQSLRQKMVNQIDDRIADMLIESGLNPGQEDSFSQKLRCVHDGNVGENAIRILIRDCARQVNFVGISDAEIVNLKLQLPSRS